MPTTDLPQNNETTDGMLLPEFTYGEESEHQPGKFINGLITEKFFLNTVQAMNEWVFSPEFMPKRFKSITIAPAKSEDLPDYLTLWHTKVCDNQANIYFHPCYVRDVWNFDQDLSVMENLGLMDNIFGRLTWLLMSDQLPSDDNYPSVFWIGIANYAGLRAGSFPAEGNLACQKDEMNWYGKDTMPYFLQYLDDNFKDRPVRRILAKLGPSYNKNVFQEVIGTPIATLWKNYRAFIGIEEIPEEEWTTNLDGLWIIPRLKLRIDADPKHEALPSFYDAIDKPLEAFAKVVLATFTHLYTPKTVPTRIKELRLVLRSGMKTDFDWYEQSDVAEIYLSLDTNKNYGKEDWMFSMIGGFYGLISPRKQTEVLFESMIGFIGLQDNLFKFPGWTEGQSDQEVDDDADSSQDALFIEFFLWLESPSSGYSGIMRQFFRLLRFKVIKGDEDWKSLFKGLTGKTFLDLSTEFEFWRTHRVDKIEESKSVPGEGSTNDVLVAVEDADLSDLEAPDFE